LWRDQALPRGDWEKQWGFNTPLNTYIFNKCEEKAAWTIRLRKHCESTGSNSPVTLLMHGVAAVLLQTPA
jgi:hypothetical protein